MEHHPARQGAPGATYDSNVRGVGLVSITADAEGVLRPGSAAEGEVCDAFGLPAIAADPGDPPTATGRSRARRGAGVAGSTTDQAGEPAQEG